MTRMKESGIDWIGQIPEEWEVRPIKNIVETPVTDGPHETPVLYETGIPFLSAEAVKDGILDFNYKRGYISLRDHERFKKKVSPKKDDIFIVKSGATTGNVGIVTTDEIFDIWSPLALIRSTKTLAIQKYIYFYLLSTIFRAQVEFNWSFGTQQNIGMGVIERIKVILPPISEQERIVGILDKKTAQLDKVKTLLEEQIQKLKDYRASLIYETVTKGLDKTVPMKDSGIDWIGQVPQGWGVSRLKYLVEISTGTSNTQDRSVESEGYPFFVRSQNVEKLPTYTHDTEAILTAGDGVGVGKVFHYYKGKFTAHQRVYILSNFKNIESKFLFYYVSINLKNEVSLGGAKSTVDSIRMPMLSNFMVSIPSSTEQLNISNYLDCEIKRIQAMIEIKQNQIENIDKQRQTLIYDYVTGKRRV